jgi:putative heme transporter
VLPIAIALLLATVLAPQVERLRRRGVSAAAAAATVLLGALAVLAGACALIVVPAWGELGRLDVRVRGGVERIGDWLVDGPLGLSEPQVDDTIRRSFDQLREHGDAIAGERAREIRCAPPFRRIRYVAKNRPAHLAQLRRPERRP